MSAVARAALAGCCLLALAACSGDVEDTAPRTTATAPSTTPSTTAAPSTTSAPTTTLSPQQQDEAAIRALHDRFFRMIVLTGNPPNPDHPEIAATTTGIQQQRTLDFTSRMRDLGEHADGSVTGTVMTVDLLDATHAAVIVCTTARSSRYSADGRVVATDPTDPWLTELRLLHVPTGWRVEDWFVGGGQKCDG